MGRTRIIEWKRLANDLSVVKSESEAMAVFGKDGIVYRFTEQAGRLLRDVRRLVNDSIAQGASKPRDSRGMTEEFEFIRHFAPLAWLDKHPPDVVRELEAYQSWKVKFGELDAMFRENYALFAPMPDVIGSDDIGQYGAEFWWLSTKRAEDKNPRPFCFSAGSIRQLKDCLCSESLQEKVISLALNDPISETDRAAALKHIETCSECFTLLLDVRAADYEASANRN